MTLNHYPDLYSVRAERERSGIRLPCPFRARQEVDAVSVLLGLHNGAKHVEAQLESLGRQTHRKWSLIVSDDGSGDDGRELVRRFARTMPGRDIRVVDGPCRGFVANFMHLARIAGPDVPFAAFSDQDDVWMPEKIEAAITKLRRLDPDVPALYCSRTLYVDELLDPIGPSPNFLRPPSFSNALVQSIAGGNTMVLNRAALTLYQQSVAWIGPVPSHDWWAYLLISGAGGHVIYDPVPRILYRQHGRNLVGGNAGWPARRERLRRLREGQFRTWSDQNIAALLAVAGLLSAENRRRLHQFAKLRTLNTPARLADLARAGLYRQTSLGTCALWFAALTGRI